MKLCSLLRYEKSRFSSPPLKTVPTNVFFSSSLQLKESLEQNIKAQVDEALKKKDTKPLVESMAKMLLAQKLEKKPLATNQITPQNCGIIIDWLQKIDPELKDIDLKLRQKLLFNKNPHLLTVFSHLSNWNHLKLTIDGVLTREGLNEYDAKAVLDFLSTCVFLKMQWQCNDKHKPKHDSGPQDVLKLSEKQIEVILDFCINESKEVQVQEERIKLIKSRVPLIVSCLNTSEKAKKAMNYLQGKFYEILYKVYILLQFVKFLSLFIKKIHTCASLTYFYRNS